ncbi:MAG: alpha/beta hydrolase [Rhodanobacteraceae bacterium]
MTLKTICIIAFGLLASGGVRAQTTVNVWSGAAPGSGGWSWKEKVFHDTLFSYHSPQIGDVVEDVVTPTLMAYLPERSKATGTGVVIAPGGACIFLLMKPANELAMRLQQKGVAAFVLKYRLQHMRGMPKQMPQRLSEDAACKYGIADAIRALKVVRQHANAWNISPNRIGMLGFSAGGMIASEALVLKDASLRPDFVALMYGAPFGTMPAIPAGLPPVFMAWAQDDQMAGPAMVRFYQALMKAGDKPEVHIYRTGGHGFADNAERGSTSDHWAQEFYWWLQAEGFAPKP